MLHPTALRSRALCEKHFKFSVLFWQLIQALLMCRPLPASGEYMVTSLSFIIFTVLYKHVTDLQAIWTE